jgi:hypothetical protein
MSLEKSQNPFDHLPIHDFARLSSAATGESLLTFSVYGLFDGGVTV